MERQLVCDLLALYTPAAISTPPPNQAVRRGEAKAAAVAGPAPLDVLLQALALRATGSSGEADDNSAAVVRQVALAQVTGPFFAALPDAQLQRSFLRALLLACSRDPHEACRAAARAALASAQLPAASLTPALTGGADGHGSAAAKRARGAGKTPAKRQQQQQQGGEAAATGLPEVLVPALELLQWKVDVQDAPVLVAPLCALLPGLLAAANATSDDADEEAPARCATLRFAPVHTSAFLCQCLCCMRSDCPTKHRCKSLADMCQQQPLK